MFLIPWRNGLSFGRDDDGSIIVQKKARPEEGSTILFEHRIAPNEFAAIVAGLGPLPSPETIPGAAEKPKAPAAG